jgi:3',5'-nucleoside bisphosphate phosphatase
MIIDLHIHSACSDGLYSVKKIFKKASEIGIGLLSITDHDSITCQENAKCLAEEYGISYIYGIELSVSFSHSSYKRSKPISLDFLGYEYNPQDEKLKKKLEELSTYRKKRAELILEKMNFELSKEGITPFNSKDLDEIEKTVDGAFGRPHIADYMVRKGMVKTRYEAFEKYLTKCNVEKMPLSLEEVSTLIKNTGGKLFLAHPNHPRGTSLIKLTKNINEQQKIITQSILPFIDGIECWHSSHDRNTIEQYLEYAKKMKLLVSGGSDCHQNPLIMGSVEVPDYVSGQFCR